VVKAVKAKLLMVTGCDSHTLSCVDEDTRSACSYEERFLERNSIRHTG
jgi:hypothetical protein